MALSCLVTLEEKGWISCLRLNWSWNLCSNIPALESLQSCFEQANPEWSFKFSSSFLRVLCEYYLPLSLAWGLNFVKQLAWAWSVQWQVRHLIKPGTPFCFLGFRRSSGDEPLCTCEAVMSWWTPVNPKENKCRSYGFTAALLWLEYPVRRNKYSLSDSPGELSHICHQSSI